MPDRHEWIEKGKRASVQVQSGDGEGTRKWERRGKARAKGATRRAYVCCEVVNGRGCVEGRGHVSCYNNMQREGSSGAEYLAFRGQRNIETSCCLL